MNIIKIAFGFLFGKGKSSGVFSAIFLCLTLLSLGYNWIDNKRTDRQINKLEELIVEKDDQIQSQKDKINEYIRDMKDAVIEQQQKLSEARQEAQEVKKDSESRIRQILSDRPTDNTNTTQEDQCRNAENLVDKMLELK